MSTIFRQRLSNGLKHHEACQQQRFVGVLGRANRSLQTPQRRQHATVATVSRSALRSVRLQCRAAKTPAAQPVQEDAQTAEASEPSAFEQFPLQVEWVRQPRSRMQATVEVPQPLVARIWHEVLKELRMNYKNIPGYRPQDKVPEHLIVNEHGGMDKFKFTMIEAILESTVGEAMKEHAAQMIADSDRFDDPVQALFERLDKNKSFSYRVSADLYPQLQWKTPYKDFQVQVEAVEHEDPQKAVDEQIEILRREKSKTTIVQGRGLQDGDLAVVTFEAQNPQTNEPMPNTQHERMQIDTNIPGQIPLPGLVQQMQGMTVKEKREFVLPVPPAWEDIAQGAKEARVLVSLVELFTYIDVPEVNDEWVSQNVQGQSTVAGFRETLLEAVQAEAQLNTDQKVRMEIMQELSDMVDTEVPEFMITQVAQNEFQAKLFEVGQKLGMEQMKQLSTEEVYNNYLESRRAELEMIQRAVMAADEIYEKEGLEVKEADMVAEVNAALEESRESGAKLDMEQLKEQAFSVLKATEVHNWLVANTNVNILSSKGQPVAAAAK